MYHSIMVPLDGSAFGEHALPYALDLAQRTGAALHLVQVHHAPAHRFTNVGEEEQRASERMYLDGLVQRIQGSWSVPLTTMLLDGPIVPTLDSYALTNQVDLIVMTTHGRGAFSRLWLGSVADALIRQISMPVLLIHPQDQPLDIVHTQTINHILVPLDGSSLAEHVLTHATTLGKLMQANYTLFEAVEPIYISQGTALYGGGLDVQLIDELQGLAQNYLDGISAKLREDGLHVQTAIAVGLAAHGILNYSQEHGVDLIALATHGRSGLVHALLGSVADKVIRGARVPVLLYRPSV